jgi:hypothetical protein
MTIADQLDHVLTTARNRLTDDLHTPGQTAALSYARSYWALDAELQRIATRLRTEGDRQ